MPAQPAAKRPARAPAMPRGKTLIVHSADGTRLHTEVFGPADGYPVVLAHGITCALRVWHEQINDLARDYRVIAYDHRGHGRSGVPAAAAYSLDHLAADLDAVRPPDAVTAYHAALLASANEYAKTTEEQLDVVAKAANAQQIAVANASARFRLSGADQNVAAAGNNLPPAALAALRDEPKCGPSRPGAPPTPGV